MWHRSMDLYYSVVLLDIVFSCVNNCINMIFEPPKQLKQTYYRCQDRFEIDNIIDMYDEGIQYGVCLISGKELLIYIITVNPLAVNYLDATMDCNIKLIKKSEIRLKNKHKKGGQSSARFGRIADAIRDNEVEEAANDIVEAMMYDNHTKCKIVKLIVGGFGPMKDDIVVTQIFKQYMTKYLFKIVTTNEINSNSAKNILLQLLEEISHNDIIKIDREIDELLQTKIDLLAFSEIECIPLLEEQRLKKLYVSDTIPALDHIIELDHKKIIIITKSDRVRMMGGCIGVKLYYEETSNIE